MMKQPKPGALLSRELARILSSSGSSRLFWLDTASLARCGVSDTVVSPARLASPQLTSIRRFSFPVKGHIYEMAMRLEDEDERISNLDKLFYTELSKKGNNPIYNLLPDILGKLFHQNLKRESFCNIMQLSIGSIKKGNDTHKELLQKEKESQDLKKETTHLQLTVKDAND